MDSTDCALSDFDCSCQSDSDHDSTAEQNSCEPFSQPFLQLLHFLLVWQAVYRLSNATIAALLRFLKYFVVSIASAFNIAHLKLASKSIPLTKEGILKAIKLHKVLTFTEFVVCPTCDSIYAADVCKRGGKFLSKTCCHRPFPNHPMQQKRLECGTQFMKTVRTKNGSVWKPRKFYPYYSLHKAIQNLASRPGFLECCEQWRERNDFNRLYAIFITSRKHLMAELIFTKTGAKASPRVKGSEEVVLGGFSLLFLDEALHCSLLKLKVSFWCTTSTIRL